MTVEEAIKTHIKSGRILQLATVASDQPWVCTLHYAEDDALNIYWLTLPATRHSQELEGNSRASIAIAIETDYPYVGLQVEGTASRIKDQAESAKALRLYAGKVHLSENFYNDVLAETNPHRLYKFTPKQFGLYDKVNFPEHARQIYEVTNT